MIFITGGRGSGKRDFARQTLGYTQERISPEVQDDCPVLIDLHEFIRIHGSPDTELFQQLLAKEVITCDEIGCGIVPLDEGERRWRDDVGQTATALATKAAVVVRMICGIPQVIKGELPGEVSS